MRLSLAMVVRNEEARIREAILDIGPHVNEIVLVDQASTDSTKYIARELVDHIIEHPAYGFSEASRAEAISSCMGDWVLLLDADERLTDFGKVWIRRWINAEYADFYNLRRLTRIDGEIIEDMLHPRLFRRGYVKSPSSLHTLCLPVYGARIHSVLTSVAIEHDKTGTEQQADDLRYEGLRQIG